MKPAATGIADRLRELSLKTTTRNLAATFKHCKRAATVVASEMPAYIRAAHSHARRTDPAFLLEIFETRTWARAYVAAELEMDFHEAVDGAWDAAVSYGLVDLLGADEIQRRMVVAFNAQRWS